LPVFRPLRDACQDDPDSSGWSFSGAAGIAGIQSGFTWKNPLSPPDGARVAFLQDSGCTISLTIDFPSGNYAIAVKMGRLLPGR
jgi:hypothetical protein